MPLETCDFQRASCHGQELMDRTGHTRGTYHPGTTHISFALTQAPPDSGFVLSQLDSVHQQNARAIPDTGRKRATAGAIRCCSAGDTCSHKCVAHAWGSRGRARAPAT